MGNYAEELGKVLKTKDIKKLRKFCKKWGLEAPEDDEVLEISLHKMIYARVDLPNSIRTESMFWLMERGYTPWIY
ncbi:MAG: hypothetical protein KHZ78_05345 [Peptoniphilus sp. oral taxon 375]|nr:hypothetical protein [Peptoniphilus sp. oral taxon 375]